jgi:hypothetical protein
MIEARLKLPQRNLLAKNDLSPNSFQPYDLALLFVACLPNKVKCRPSCAELLKLPVKHNFNSK